MPPRNRPYPTPTPEPLIWPQMGVDLLILVRENDREPGVWR
jgi:hypothetical protein